MDAGQLWHPSYCDGPIVLINTIQNAFLLLTFRVYLLGVSRLVLVFFAADARIRVSKLSCFGMCSFKAFLPWRTLHTFLCLILTFCFHVCCNPLFCWVNIFASFFNVD